MSLFRVFFFIFSLMKITGKYKVFEIKNEFKKER